MRAAGMDRRTAERVYAVLLRAYPPAFRAEYRAEMLRTFREWHGRRRYRGGRGALRFWGAAVADLARSVPREWAAAVGGRVGGLRDRVGVLRDRSGARPVAAGPHPPPYGAAALAGLAVFALYVATLAPAIAFWDSSEYVTAAHILGIPHPPGSPLFVLLAHAWEILLEPTGLPTAVRINLFSATLSAASYVLWFLVVDRVLAGWTDERVPRREDGPRSTDDRLLRRIGALAAVIVSATAFTVWNQSNVNEKVYAVPFFTTALVSWLLFRWRDTGRRPKTLLIALVVVALSATNHLMGVLVAPAALLFVLLVDRRVLLRPRFWVAALPLAAVALSVQFFLPIRAADRPIIAEGEPTCESAPGAAASVYTWGHAGCEALSAVLTREQYDKPSVRLDPTVYPRQEVPRGPALVASQFKNYIQYFDWQWARSVAGKVPVFGGLRPLVTLVFLLLGLLGARTHWRADRRSAVYLGVLFLTLSAGLVLYLNFKYGYAIARDRFPDPEMHEVRERDYFYLIGFGVWGLWSGVGLTALWSRAAEALRSRLPHPRPARVLAAPVLGLALLPLALNWGWASRADDYTARDWAYNVLMSVEPYGVLFTNGDNDTFPLWYLQEVEGIRQDVTVIVGTYLRTPWYVKQLRQLTAPCPEGVDAAATPTRIVCQRPFDAAELPRALVRAGWRAPAEPPEDSIVPLSEEQIERIARSYFVTRDPLTLRAGRIESTIAAGTPMLASDTFTAAILQGTVGERPIHFMPGSPVVEKLGLRHHTVRQGIVWKIHDGASPAADREGVVPLSRTSLSVVAGAAIDLPLTDTLVWDVYLRRGRILDEDAPWVDAATTSILMQYVYTHYAAAQGHASAGGEEAFERHVRRARWWEGVVGR